MHVAMVSEHASPLAVLGGVLGGQDAGGQNVHVAALSAALAARGHQVSVYTRRDDPRLGAVVPLVPGVEVVHVPAGPPRPMAKDDLLDLMPAMGRWIAADWRRRGTPDLVHAHFWMSGVAVQVALGLLSPAQRPASAITFHALGSVKRRHQGSSDTSPNERLLLERRLLHSLDAVVATCADEVRELLALGAEPERMHVVPCGVDLDTFSPHGPRAGGWRPGAARLVTLGRLVERKGVDTAITALAGVQGAELVVAGGPAPSRLDDDPDVPRLRAVACAAGVTDRVRFVGRVDPAGAAALLRSADLVLAVPWYEPFGIVPLEAMACGTPVVASAVGGMLDTVEDGCTGAHVPPRDPAALAATVRTLLERPAELAALGRTAAAHTAARYSWQRVAAGTEAVYDRLCPPATTLHIHTAWQKEAR